METIKTYLENLFSSLPKSKEIIKIKEELLCNMEDKYNELKEEGKTENEAIGIVISEFGNIDELLNELNITPNNNLGKNNNFPVLDKDFILNYIIEKRKASKLIGLGVALCIIAISSIVLFSQLISDKLIFSDFSQNFKDSITVIPLFLLVAVAVGLFIYSGLKLEKFKYITEGKFNLSFDAEAYLKKEQSINNSKFSLKIIIGVCLCVFSPVIIFIGSAISDSASSYSVVFFLITIAIAVSIFINVGTNKDLFEMLLNTKEYSKFERKEEDKVIGCVASIVWPLAAAFYLFMGFIYDKWGTAWIVFPIVGILFGRFSGAYSAIKSKNH